MEYERDIKKSMILREIAPTSGRDGAISLFARHGRALTGVSPEHAQVVGNV